MNTKIVYVTVSRNSDCYLEMTWVSAWSAKFYNPDAHITFVADKDTVDGIYSSYRRDFFKLVDEIIPIEIPGDLTNMEKSRWLKTNLRNLVTGDYLFIDSDTIVTGDLSLVDDFKCQLGMVLNWQIKLSEGPYLDEMRPLLKNIFNYIGPYDDNYFNSGVMYCKDTYSVKKIYDEWHENWKLSNNAGWKYDQLGLYKAQLDNPGVIEELDGIYNCQITVALKSLYKAKIVHFFSADNTTFTPFKRKETYMGIKSDGGLSDELKNQIVHCKECFYGPTLIQDKGAIYFCLQPAYSLLHVIYDRFPSIFKVLNNVSLLLIKTIKKIKGYAKKRRIKEADS